MSGMARIVFGTMTATRSGAPRDIGALAVAVLRVADQHCRRQRDAVLVGEGNRL